MNRNELIEHMNTGFEPDFLFFWGHRPNKDGSVGQGCLSQWWPSSFEVDGVEYATAEHFMMAEKARLFGDDEMLEAIVNCVAPNEAKAYGRKVRNFDKQRWNARRFDAVVEGNVAKFSQNEAEQRFLLSTGERVLVEASPRDRIWGIGMGAKNPHARDPAQWRGSNLLGFALMEARERLRGEA